MSRRPSLSLALVAVLIPLLLAGCDRGPREVEYWCMNGNRRFHVKSYGDSAQLRLADTSAMLVRREAVDSTEKFGGPGLSLNVFGRRASVVRGEKIYSMCVRQDD